jgi:hypothetical protein
VCVIVMEKYEVCEWIATCVVDRDPVSDLALGVVTFDEFCVIHSER